MDEIDASLDTSTVTRVAALLRSPRLCIDDATILKSSVTHYWIVIAVGKGASEQEFNL